jgi:hypothetical protein
MDNNYKGLIWTNHAIMRMRERGIKQGDAWATWNRPEQSYKANLHKGGEAWRYYRTWGNQRIEVVAKQNEKREWIVISVWSDPVSLASTTVPSLVEGKSSFWANLLNILRSH